MKEACEATITANKLVCSRPSWPARHDAEAYLLRPRLCLIDEHRALAQDCRGDL